MFCFVCWTFSVELRSCRVVDFFTDEAQLLTLLGQEIDCALHTVWLR